MWDAVALYVIFIATAFICFSQRGETNECNRYENRVKCYNVPSEQQPGLVVQSAARLTEEPDQGRITQRNKGMGSALLVLNPRYSHTVNLELPQPVQLIATGNL